MTNPSPPKNYQTTTIHRFKTNMSRHIRELENGLYDAVIVCRHNEQVGLFMPFKRLRDRAHPGTERTTTPDKTSKYPAHKPPLPWES
jgi:antitoxin (DNA-binding transcriptional repressor) of toxin-antitoxin stability system